MDTYFQEAKTGTETPSTTDLWLFDDQWDKPRSARDVQAISTIFGTEYFGGEVYGRAAGRLGMKFELSGYGGGTYDVDYPVDIVIGFPQPNTFRAGEAVLITTSWSTGDLDLFVAGHGIDMQLKGVFSMQNSLSDGISLSVSTH